MYYTIISEFVPLPPISTDPQLLSVIYYFDAIFCQRKFALVSTNYLWEAEIRNFPKNLDPHFILFNIKEEVEKPPWAKFHQFL